MNYFERGSGALKALLRTKLHDIRDENPETFPRWLGRHLRGWAVDPVFQQRMRIRDLRILHPELQILERERDAVRGEFEAAPEYREHETLRRELAGVENAVAGLSHAHRQAHEDGERARLQEKLASYEAMANDLRRALEALRRESSVWQRLHAVATRLSEARLETGFDHETLRLSDLQRSHGRSGGRSGNAFEVASAEVVRLTVVPELERATDGSELVLINRVRLGSSRAEFDHLVIKVSEDPTRPVTVLAAVEAKRNPNDLAHGFRHRKANLDWFLGRSDRYDSAEYRTGHFPQGHFDRPGVHLEKGRRFIFTRESFAIFDEERNTASDAVHLPAALWFVTRPAPLWGIGSGGLARMAHRISSDTAFNLDSSAYVAALLGWSLNLTHEVEAPDILQSFASDEVSAKRVLLLPVV